MISASGRAVLTIGHSNHLIERFMELLAMHGVERVVDVRSAPYSRLHPQFNRARLRRALENRGVGYAFLGRELGARPRDRSCYDDGQVQYGRLTQTPLFRRGIDDLLRYARDAQVAILCAEREPLVCHRSLLVAREIEALGSPVAHIHADGSLETHESALRRLLGSLHLPEVDLFSTPQELIDEAYARQGRRVAYVAVDLLPAMSDAPA